MLMRGKIYVFVMVCLSLASLVYFFASKVKDVSDQIADTREKLIRYDEDLKVLEAEWSYLNNPARLTQLAEKVDDKMNSPVRIQFTNLRDLPVRGVMLSSAETNIQQLVP